MFAYDFDCTLASHACCKISRCHDENTMRVYYTPFLGRKYSRLCADQVAHWKEYGWNDQPIEICQQCWKQH
jgi:hypothetical protein